MATTVTTPRTGRRSGASIEFSGLAPEHHVHWNYGPAELVEHAIRRKEGMLADGGPFCAVTSPHTGRSPNDKFVVKEASSEAKVWWGKVNQPIAPEHFDRLHADVLRHLNGQEIFVRDLFAGADPDYRLPVRFVTPNAWQALFVYNMFLRPSHPELAAFTPEWQVLHAPELHADPKVHGTKSSTFIVVNLARRIILIGGTRYAGEMKKSIFTILNYLLPQRGVLPMHCSANVGEAGDVALFFGLSGTGKTTLSSDPERGLIGDDEHGWSDRGIFNFEAGCYAKVIKQSREAEPQIWDASRRFGTILENVVLDPDTRAMALDDSRYPEITRSSYPLSFIPNAIPSGQAGHPKNVVMLAADAYGAMPPIARLTPESAMYHFLSGYTARVAGTEKGVTEPKATFSTCFGAPFLPLPPQAYAKLLGEKIARHRASVWLVNTGWSGGPYGVGTRISLAYTRALIDAVLSGQLDAATYRTDPIFNLAVPASVPGVPDSILT